MLTLTRRYADRDYALIDAMEHHVPHAFSEVGSDPQRSSQESESRRPNHGVWKEVADFAPAFFVWVHNRLTSRLVFSVEPFAVTQLPAIGWDVAYVWILGGIRVLEICIFKLARCFCKGSNHLIARPTSCIGIRQQAL